MELIVRILGLELSLFLGPVQYEEEEGEVSSLIHLTTSDNSFGFAPDPVFPELDWGEEE